MTAATSTIDRDTKGRFRPGASGNPAGKKTGTKNRATILKEALRDGEDTSVARVVIDKAIAGDAVAARFLLERLEPKPRGRPIHLEIPEGLSPAAEVVATFNAAMRAMAAGEITPDEAVSVARFLEGRIRVLKAWKLEMSLVRWDDPLPIPGDDKPSPIPYPPPKQGWPSFHERVRLWGSPWPPPVTPSAKAATPSPTPTTVSSPPARGEKDAKGRRGEAEPYPKLDEGPGAAREVAENPGTNPSAGAAPPHPAPTKLDDVSLSLRNPLPAARGEEKDAGDALFSPHLRSLIEASMADPTDNRWLPVLAEEWGVPALRDLHLTCKSQAPATQEEPPVAAVSPPAAAPRLPTPPAPSPQDWVSATPMPRPRRRAEMPRVITRRPH
jgi:hypothetical protein